MKVRRDNLKARDDIREREGAGGYRIERMREAEDRESS